MDLIVNIANLILAAAATCIAIMDFLRTRKEKKEEEERRNVIKKISESFSTLEKLINFCSKYQDDENSTLEKPIESPKNIHSISSNVPNSLDILYDDKLIAIEKSTSRTDSSSDALLLYAKQLSEIVNHNRSLIEDCHLFETIESAYTTLLKYEDKFPMAYGYNRFIDAFRGMVLLKDEYESTKSMKDPKEIDKIYDKIYEEMKKITPYIREIQIKYDLNNK